MAWLVEVFAKGFVDSQALQAGSDAAAGAAMAGKDRVSFSWSEAIGW